MDGNRRWKKRDLYSLMYGCFAIGAITTIFASGARLYGLGFIVVGLIIASILQFVFGDDVIKIRNIKRIK